MTCGSVSYTHLDVYKRQLHNAEGSGQRSIALGLTVFNLIGVGLITIAEIVLRCV